MAGWAYADKVSRVSFSSVALLHAASLRFEVAIVAKRG